MASLAEALAETFLPATCTLCGGSLPWRGAAAGVCGQCWGSVIEHERTGCPVCGDPEVVADAPCLSCSTSPPPWRSAASFGSHEGTLRALINLYKHGRRDELAEPLATLLARAWHRRGWPDPDLVVAVPVPWLRRLRRGFDHAELLARHLARGLARPCVPALRRRHGRPQVGQTRTGRLALTAAAFSRRRPVSGRVLLLDDVFTTGATATACATALARAGAREVFVLTLARAPRSGRIP
ncbi:MAG: double zinc ribbon domain-containing protein [Acidobacteriota bacterium]